MLNVKRLFPVTFFVKQKIKIRKVGLVLLLILYGYNSAHHICVKEKWS